MVQKPESHTTQQSPCLEFTQMSRKLRSAQKGTPGLTAAQARKPPAVLQWVHGPWSIQTVGCYSALQRNELPSLEKTRRTLKQTLPSESSASAKPARSLIPAASHPSAGARQETGGGRGAGRDAERSPEGVRGDGQSPCDDVTVNTCRCAFVQTHRMDTTTRELTRDLWPLATGACPIVANTPL